MHDLETCQKILLKCGANGGSDLQCWRNLVEKVNAKKIDFIPMRKKKDKPSELTCSSGHSSHFYGEKRRENVSSYGLTKQYHSAQIYDKIIRNAGRNGG